MGIKSQIDFLKNMAELMDSVGDPDKLIQTIIAKAVKVTKASDGALLIIDPATERLVFHTATGRGDKDLKGLELSRGEGIAGWVFENKKPLFSRDVSRDNRWSKNISQKT
ncbi:MAG: GAF domain-containing protein, partial [Nitrospinota bacterium]